MSEVTELTKLTDDEFVDELWQMCGLTVMDSPAFRAELLRRLSTQGAGQIEDAAQRCAWVADAWAMKNNLPTSTKQAHDLLRLAMADELRKFFRAPSDPPRPELGTFIRNLRHKDGCAWATELPTGGGQYWGCNCGLDNVLIHLEDYEVKAVDEHGREVKR